VEVLVAEGTTVFVAVEGIAVFVAVAGIVVIVAVGRTIVEVKVGSRVAVGFRVCVGSGVAVTGSDVGKSVAAGSGVSVEMTTSVGTGVQSAHTTLVAVGLIIISPPSEKRIVQPVITSRIIIHNIFRIMLPPDLNIMIQVSRCKFLARSFDTKKRCAFIMNGSDFK
jgi:hypothetical protein